MKRHISFTLTAAITLVLLALPGRAFGGTNAAPVATDDSYSVHGGQTLTVPAPGLLANDSDPDGDPLAVIAFNGPDNGTADWSADGGFTYTPNSWFIGADTFTYIVQDPLGDWDEGTITINVANTAPTETDASYSTPSDHALSVPAPGLLAYASDADGDALIAQPGAQPSHGAVFVYTNGSFQYYPNEGFVGQDSFTYFVRDNWSDSGGHTVWLDVWDSNHPPVAVDDTWSTHADTSLYVYGPGVLSNDSDPDGNWIFVSSNGFPQHGSISMWTDGGFYYTPDTWFLGTDSVSYTISDGKSGTASATLYINVTNKAPTATDSAYSTPNNVPLTVNWPGFLSGAYDADGDSVKADVTGPPAHGTLVAGAWGDFTYTPDGTFVGDDSFTFVPKDFWSTGDPHTVTIHLGAPDGLPVAVDDVYSMRAGTTMYDFPPGVLANDSDPDGDALHVSSISVWPSDGQLYWDADGSFNYVPAGWFAGTDTFSYVVTDTKGGSAVGTVTINVLNATPTALDSSYSTMMNTTLTVPAPGFMTGAADGDGDAIAPSVMAWPQHGSLNYADDGGFTYEPDAGFVGDDLFTFSVSDNFSTSDTHTVTIHVVSPDQPPVAVADSYTARKNNVLTVGAPGVLANDSDPNGDAMTAVKVTSPSHGTLVFNANGSFKYTPTRGYTGADSFTYKVLANGKYSNTVTVSINVIVPKK